MFPGLRGTIRIGKLYNDTEKVKELMLWWSSNVGERISKLQQNISFDCKDNATCTELKDQPIKGNIYRLSIFFLGQYYLIIKSTIKFKITNKIQTNSIANSKVLYKKVGFWPF